MNGNITSNSNNALAECGNSGIAKLLGYQAGRACDVTDNFKDTNMANIEKIAALYRQTGEGELFIHAGRAILQW